MKRNLFLCLLLLIPCTGFAQTALPYYSGFDNTTQKSGWTTIRNGSQMAVGWNYSENFAAGYTPPSAPNCLQHPPATSGDPNNLTIDFFTSPGLNLSSGGKVAFKINVFTMAGLMTGDSIGLYLFHGSSKTLLADLKGFSSSNKNFKDTLINIPPTTGTAFLSFRYTTYNNWLSVAIDNINVTANPNNVATPGNASSAEQSFVIFPNPATDRIQWDLNYMDHVPEVHILDVSGRIVKKEWFKRGMISTNDLDNGLYYIRCGDQTRSFIKE